MFLKTKQRLCVEMATVAGRQKSLPVCAIIYQLCTGGFISHWWLKGVVFSTQSRKRSGVEGLIEIENPNRVSQKSKKVAELDLNAPKELSRRERWVSSSHSEGIFTFALLYFVLASEIIRCPQTWMLACGFLFLLSISLPYVRVLLFSLSERR